MLLSAFQLQQFNNSNTRDNIGENLKLVYNAILYPAQCMYLFCSRVSQYETGTSTIVYLSYVTGTFCKIKDDSGRCIKLCII